MSWQEFEIYLVEMYRTSDFKVFETQASGDFGADFILKKSKSKIGLLCKQKEIERMLVSSSARSNIDLKLL